MEETADLRHDGGEEYPDGTLPPPQLLIDEVERSREIPFGNGLADLKNDPGMAHRDDAADLLGRHRPTVREEGEFLQLAVDDPGIGPDEEDKALEGPAFKVEAQPGGPVLDVAHDVDLPPRLARVELVKDFDLGAF